MGRLESWEGDGMGAGSVLRSKISLIAYINSITCSQMKRACFDKPVPSSLLALNNSMARYSFLSHTFFVGLPGNVQAALPGAAPGIGGVMPAAPAVPASAGAGSGLVEDVLQAYRAQAFEKGKVRDAGVGLGCQSRSKGCEWVVIVISGWMPLGEVREWG